MFCLVDFRQADAFLRTGRGSESGAMSEEVPASDVERIHRAPAERSAFCRGEKYLVRFPPSYRNRERQAMLASLNEV